MRRWAVVSAVLAVACYAAMWLGYRQGWGWLHDADWSALNALHDVGVKHPGWVRFWDGVCTVFGPTVFRLAGMVLVVVEVVLRRLRAALFLLVSIELSGFVTRLAKASANRPRPTTMLVAVPESAFPSGHALAAMVAVCALLAVLLPLLWRRFRSAAVVAGLVVVAAVGFGRVALNVHHPSDVLAGWALGYLYFLACLPLLASVPGRRRPADRP